MEGGTKKQKEEERERERDSLRTNFLDTLRGWLAIAMVAHVSKQTAHPVHICAFIPFAYPYVECFELDQTEAKRPDLLTRIYLPIKST